MIWSTLMDSKSLFLTANADTVYYMGILDLSNGPLIFETPPPGSSVSSMDMWFHWVTDFGLPGAERGEGGKYLLVGPGYDGPLPEGRVHYSQVQNLPTSWLARPLVPH